MGMNNYVEQGKSHAGRNEFSAAAECFRKALESEPDNETALFELGKAHYCLKEYPEAEGIFRRLVGHGPSNRDALDLLAKTYKEMGRSDLALQTFEEILLKDPSNAGLCRELADSYKAEKKYPLAETMYEKILDEYPGDFSALLELVQLYNFEGKYERAREKIRASSIDPSQLDDLQRNQLLNEREIAEQKSVLASKPRVMLVTLTNRCNLKCPMCGRSANPWDVSDKIRNEIVSLLPCLELITWQGGEVFMYPHFKALLRETRKYPKLKQIIITNGLLIDRGWAEELAGQENVDLTISIDSVRKSVYEKLRLGAQFERLIESVRAINESRDRHSSRMVLTLRCAIMKSNYREMESFIDFAREYRFDVVLMFPIAGERDPENIFALKDRDALKYLNDVRPLIRKKADDSRIRLLDWLPYDNEECVPAAPTEKGSAVRPDAPAGNVAEVARAPLCLRPWRQIAVNVNGTIFPECLCSDPAGTVFENSFADVWNNEKMKSYRLNILNGKHDQCNRSCCAGVVPPEHLKFICG